MLEERDVMDTLIASIAIVTFYLVLAGFSGWFINRVSHAMRPYALGIGLSLFFFSSIGLPFSLAGRIATWLVGLAVMLLFAVSPFWLPAWSKSRGFLFSSMGWDMVFIIVWAAMSPDRSITTLFVIPAALIILLAVHKIAYQSSGAFGKR